MPLGALGGYIDIVDRDANMPAKPDEMEQILAFNRGRAEMKVQA